jgi:hypothetical protein
LPRSDLPLELALQFARPPDSLELPVGLFEDYTGFRVRVERIDLHSNIATITITKR